MVEASALFTDITEKQAKAECVDALNHVHMEDAEKNRLEDICCPERKEFLRMVHGDAAVD